ncbi:type VII secretion protein EsaA [Neobacillus vireti]|uniref:type VII secretion protein EsaA n=1 Tax=Neobacillus vireti TaxID=220686 RepID=UPI0030004AD8
MKKLERGILLFLILVLVLSSGISYLALNQASKGKNNIDNQKMRIALVNEDQGAEFNEEYYEFGNGFIKGIEKDSQYDWYVVSRGVAENGLKRNVYHMIIVIPNDFTQKALSIDSKSPEKVVLNYKINASENSNMKAEAEKTASSILGEFNRRIIDVYFASVIGNLHDAQDNVSTLVNKEQLYTNVYHQDIQRPLTGYTLRLGAVQDHTNVSRDSFKGLQDILKEFESSMGEGVQTSHTYQSSFMDFTKKQAADMLLSKGFSEQLGDFNSKMNQRNVLQQLDDLRSANKAINGQFHSTKDKTATMLSESAAIQAYLTSTKEKMEKVNTELVDQLAADMQQFVAEKLKREINHSAGKEQSVHLNHIFARPDANVRTLIQKQMDLLPSLDQEDLDGLGLKKITLTQLKNVIAVSKQYNKEFGYTPNLETNSLPLSDQVKEIKHHLMINGVMVTDSVILPEANKSGQEFTLSIPKEFSVAQVLLTLPNRPEMDYTKPFLKNKQITLPETDKGSFTVKVKVKLKEIAATIDVFQPITWNWEMEQKDVTQVDTPVPPETAGEPSSPTEQKTGQLEEVTPGVSEEKGGPANDTIASVMEATENERKTVEQNKNAENKNEPTTGDQNNNEPKNDPKNPAEIVMMVNNTIQHQVMSPLMSDATSVLINAASDTVSEYQKLLMLYGAYFGIGLEQFNQPNLENQLIQTNLRDMATVDSLYYLFNKEDIVEVLANYVAKQITEEVRQQTVNLKSKMDEYVQLVNGANQNSMQMMEMIKQTMAQAEILNTNLSNTLQDLAAWREASLQLQEAESTILLNEGEEQTAILALGSGLNSLLAASQALADQSKNNATTADHVFKTFAAIDQQAKEIQVSGTTLVKQAGDLSENLTNKLVEDKNFAQNFGGVLANSRIGQRPNEHLLSFLSNPVQTKNAGVIQAGDTFTPYFLVLICFIVALFTAYVLSIHERKRLQNDSFAEETTLIGRNTPLTIITASIGLVEGLAIGLLSSYLLQISEEKILLWIGMITLIMLAMLLVAAYLLRQLKMIGMFILLVMLSLYLFFTEALGLQFDKASLAAKLREYSPLQYIEKLFMQFSSGAADNKIIIGSLLALIVLSLIGHLLVLHHVPRNKEAPNEEISESL